MLDIINYLFYSRLSLKMFFLLYIYVYYTFFNSLKFNSHLCFTFVTAWTPYSRLSSCNTVISVILMMIRASDLQQPLIVIMTIRVWVEGESQGQKSLLRTQTVTVATTNKSKRVVEQKKTWNLWQQEKKKKKIKYKTRSRLAWCFTTPAVNHQI